ncbi:hypothetical protein KSF_096800 [Reticulibacter mediterranei]|uniref:Uncharacterized protein n=1 Tax=Reticulibacter mediterranei TaxID=2778369 RepID=A0A8J3N9S3_9CHLR|nr:hypothetical protein [Reticulibacter mediterranei]GHO99632.1 hypothetical protein KSF_096800 [Reticulibacter mediterranei]
MTDNPGEVARILAHTKAEHIAAQRGLSAIKDGVAPHKPGLIDLLNTHSVNTVFLARAARLPIVTVRAMALQGKPVQPVVAMQVLYGLWVLTGQRYLLTDVNISVLPYNETSE